MLRLKFAPVFILAFGLINLVPAPILAWQTSQTAKSICENEKASIDWTFINREGKRAIKLTVKDLQSGKSTQTRTVTAGQATSGTFETGKVSIQASSLSFLVKWADGEKGTDTVEVSYKKIACESSPVAGATEGKPKDPPVQPLPNTGPLDALGPFAAFLAASASSWLITRKELIKAVKQL